MGRFVKYWSVWARIKWLFTGQAPADFNAVQAEINEMRFKLLEHELDSIRLRHEANKLREQQEMMTAWLQRTAP
jgi:hypothetical protein